MNIYDTCERDLEVRASKWSVTHISFLITKTEQHVSQEPAIIIPIVK